MQKSVAEDPNDPGLLELSPNEIGDVCFQNLGGLNANRIPARPLESFDRLSALASTMSMFYAFPIWSWIAQNVARKRGAANKSEAARRIFEGACSSGELVLALIGKTRTSYETSDVSIDGLIKPGDREQVFARICAWAKQNVDQEIRISDPFFGADDLEMIFRISEVAPSAKIQILTSKKHMREQFPDGDLEAEFQSSWGRLCDVDPPDVTIGVVGSGNDGAHPIHDRWIVSRNSGLRLGTSANSIGLVRMSEISDMDSMIATTKFDAIGKVLNRDIRSWEGVKLHLSTFNLH
jgi:hypothetical protein